jgi:4-hydroxyphenylacetate 3-monooxygenase
VAVVEALIAASDARPHEWPSGFLSPNLQAMYAMTAWSAEAVPGFLHSIRVLLGSQPFQQAADSSIFEESEGVNVLLEALGAGSVEDARERYKLMKLAWDLIGSEFASRHLQYEMFYAGARHVTRGRMAHIFDWSAVDEVADRCLADVDQWTRSQRAVTA